ncbi:MAG: hypothetical protein D8M59_13670 [Planctomycetes bacterium]|nr:hypothetical protein [Planctomycetota bacterium]NOG53739.1 hypothetical protein [Planctomycetota bacterium]
MPGSEPQHPDVVTNGSEEDLYDILDPPRITIEEPWEPPLPMHKERPCPSCGYDMRGSKTDVCPECGTYYKDAQEKAIDNVQHWIDIYSFRWILYGLIPMLIWAVPAWVTIKFGNPLAHTLAVLSGFAGCFICASWAAVKANEEVDFFSGLFFSFTIFIGVLMTSTAIMGFVLMLAQ